MIELRHQMWMLGLASAAVAFVFLVSRHFGDHANLVFGFGIAVLLALPFFAVGLMKRFWPMPRSKDEERE